MKKIRSFVIAIIIMIIVSILCLLVVSTLAYLFKWQADKAMVGIILTYILAGFSGGMSLKLLHKEKTKLRNKGIEAFAVSNIYMIILLILSALVVQNPFEISGRMLMIWMLLMSSAFLGRIL